MGASMVLFTYALGAVFALGGIAFMLFLDDNRFTFGVPYLVIGLLLVFGARGSSRRRARDASGEDGPGGGGH